MNLIIEPQIVPLYADQDGIWRVGDSRVLLSSIIEAFNLGRTLEDIVQSYDTLTLEDVYGVIAYYLSHRLEVDKYLRTQQEETESLWTNIRARPDYQAFRRVLLQRRQQTQSPQ